ncbi:hypothetical protein M3Y94_00172800 [Aphelenchoides besseyi]|nr:hypothetical protein M3Y94_00172800 [Aphelenchoides besseyi]
MSNLTSVRHTGKLMTVDGRPLNPIDSRDMNMQLEELVNEKKRLDRKLVTNTHAFKDVLIYCKKTIENQDFQVERLNNENLMIKTQLSNLDQLELELKESQQQLLVLQKGDRRKEREDWQTRAKKNIVKKVKADMQKVEQERLHIQLELQRVLNDLETKNQAYTAMEKEKQRLDTVMQKANDAANQRLDDVTKGYREACENLFYRCINNWKKSKRNCAKITRNMRQKWPRFREKFETREIISRKLQEQNRKLIALRDFFETVFETNNDNYIDLMLGENRSAVFAKLSTLLRTIPILTEGPSNDPIVPERF